MTIDAIANTATFDFANLIRNCGDAGVVWVRFLDNGRIIPVDAATGEFTAVLDTKEAFDHDLNQDGEWHNAMLLSYALSGWVYHLDDAFDGVVYDKLRCVSLSEMQFRVNTYFPNWAEREGASFMEILTLDDLNARDHAELAAALGVNPYALKDLLALAAA